MWIYIVCLVSLFVFYLQNVSKKPVSWGSREIFQSAEHFPPFGEQDRYFIGDGNQTE